MSYLTFGRFYTAALLALLLCSCLASAQFWNTLPYNAVGAVTANQCILAGEANAYVNDPTTTDYNYTATFGEGLITHINVDGINPSEYCTGCQLIASINPVTLIAETLSNDGRFISIQLRSNSSVAPIACAVDSDCYGTAFWPTTWPDYYLPNNASDSCVFCSTGGRCIGRVDLYANGTLRNDPSVYPPGSVQIFAQPSTCVLVTLDANHPIFPTFQDINAISYYEYAVYALYMSPGIVGDPGIPKTTQTDVVACDSYGRNATLGYGEIYFFLSSNGACGVFTTCNAKYNRAPVYTLTFSSGPKATYRTAIANNNFEPAQGLVNNNFANNSAAVCAYAADCYADSHFMSAINTYWNDYIGVITGQMGVTFSVINTGRTIEALCLNGKCAIGDYTYGSSGSTVKAPLGWSSEAKNVSLKCSYLMQRNGYTITVDLGSGPYNLNTSLFNSHFTNPCQQLDRAQYVVDVYSLDCPESVILNGSSWYLTVAYNDTSVPKTCTLGIHCSATGTYAYDCDGMRNGTSIANKRGSIYNTYLIYYGYINQSLIANTTRSLPFTAPGMVSSNACFASASANAWTSRTSFGYNTNVTFEAVVVSNLSLSTVSMSNFCNNSCLVTASTNRPTLVEHTFGANNATITIKLRANNTVAPIACTTDANCQSGVFWSRQWPIYQQPGNSTDPCARCINNICMGFVDIASNGSVVTDPSTCGIDGSGSSPFPSANLLPPLVVEESLMRLYTNGQSVTGVSPSSCLAFGASFYGSNTAIEYWYAGGGNCNVGPMCNGDASAANIYRVSFNYMGSKYYETWFGSPYGFHTPFAAQSAATCTRSIDCYNNAVFMSALSEYWNDPLFFVYGEAYVSGSAIVTGETVEPLCLNNKCAIGDYKPSVGEPLAPIGWYSETQTLTYKCSYLLTPNLGIDWSNSVYDLNTTLFNSHFTNPCQAMDRTQQVVDVYSLDCPNSVILNAQTNTYQLVITPSATVTPQNCTLRIQCTASGAYAYDCDGPRNGSLFNNTRGSIYANFVTFNGYITKPTALFNVPGYVQSYMCYRAAESNFIAQPNTGNLLNTTATFEISSEGLSTVATNLTSYCSSCTVRQSTQRWTLILHQYTASQSGLSIFYRSNSSATPISCTTDSQCRGVNFWQRQWPVYALPNNASDVCTFCIDTICGGLVEIAANGTIITNTSSCPLVVGAFREQRLGAIGSVTTSSYSTIKVIPMEQQIDNLYRTNQTASNACTCRQQAISTHGTGGEFTVFSSPSARCNTFATCNGNTNRAQPLYVSFVAGNLTSGYTYDIFNRIDWIYAYTNQDTYTNQGRLSLFANNSAQTCTTTYQCLTNPTFKTALAAWSNNVQYYQLGRGSGTAGQGIDGVLGVGAMCLAGSCQVAFLDNRGNDSGPLGWDDTTCTPTTKCHYAITPNTTLTPGQYIDLNSTLFSYQFTHPCRAYNPTADAIEIYSSDCPGAVLYNTTSGTYQLIAAPPDVFNPSRQLCHLSIRCSASINATYDCDGPRNKTISTTNARGSIYNAFYVQAPVPSPATSIATIPGLVRTYECFRSAQSNLVPQPNIANALNTTAPFEIWSENLSLTTANLTSYCQSCTLRQASHRWTLLEHRYTQDQSAVSIYLRANNYSTPIACTTDTDCINSAFWSSQWPMYNMSGNGACTFCIDTICGGIVEVAYNNTPITNTSTCPNAVAAFRVFKNGTVPQQITAFDYTTIMSLPVEQQIDNLYRGNFVTANACACRQTAIATHGSGGDLSVFTGGSNTCTTIATCNGNTQRAQIYYAFVTGGNLITGYTTTVRNLVDFTPWSPSTYLNQGRVSLLPNNSAVACNTTHDCLSSATFLAALTNFTHAYYPYVYGRGDPTLTLSQGSGQAGSGICLYNTCHVMWYAASTASNGPLGWNDNTCSPSFHCNHFLPTNLTITPSYQYYDLNTTLFNSPYTHPCQAFYSNVSALEIYSKDCPGAVTFNTTTLTYQLIAQPPDIFNPAPQRCHLSVRCDVSWSLYPYDCDGPKNTSISTTNWRDSINNVFYVQAPAAPAPTFIRTIPGLVQTYQCYVSAESVMVPLPNVNDTLNTTATYEIWSENLNTGAIDFNTYCNACTIRESPARWTLLEHRYSQNQTLVSTYLRATNYSTPISCTVDTDCSNSNFWATQWPMYNSSGNSACTFCIDTICGGIVEVAYNNSVITNTSTCPHAIAAFRFSQQQVATLSTIDAPVNLRRLSSQNYATIKTLPIEQQIDNLYRANHTASSACACRQQAQSDFGGGGEFSLYDYGAHTCYTIGTCNGNTQRAQIINMQYISGNITAGYVSAFVNRVDWTYTPLPDTYLNQGRVSLFDDNSAQPCNYTIDCLRNPIFQTLLNTWAHNYPYYVWGRGAPDTLSQGNGWLTNAVCLTGSCHVMYSSNWGVNVSGPYGWDDATCAPSFHCNYYLPSNLTIASTDAPVDLNSTLFDYQFTHPCQAFLPNVSAVSVFSADCPNAVIFNSTTNTYQLVGAPPDPYGAMPQLCHLSIHCDTSWSPYPYDCDGTSTNPRGSIYNSFYVSAPPLPVPVTPPVTPPTAPIAPPTPPPVAPPTSPPVEPPTSPPVEPPISPPVEPPTSPPVAPPTTPVAPPTSPPTEPPASPPVAPPTTPPPTSPPIEPPTSPPVEPPISPPVEPPTSPPVEPPTTPPPTSPPVVPPTSPPVMPPTSPPVEPPTSPPVVPPTTPPTSPPVEPPTSPPVVPPTTPPPTSPPVAPPTTPVAPPTLPPVVPPTTPPHLPPATPIVPHTPPPTSPKLPISTIIVIIFSSGIGMFIIIVGIISIAPAGGL